VCCVVIVARVAYLLVVAFLCSPGAMVFVVVPVVVRVVCVFF